MEVRFFSSAGYLCPSFGGSPEIVLHRCTMVADDEIVDEHVTVDLSKKFGGLKAGKSIASTEGGISVPGNREIRTGLERDR
jgi:hypothetical protein